MQANCIRLQALTQSIMADGYTGVLLLGMGGSSLASEVFAKTFGGHGLALSVLDSTDPGRVLELDAQLDPAKTLYIVATKSGGTVETFSFFNYFYNRVVTAVAGYRLGIHPFDQPNVEAAKVLARQLVTQYAKTGQLPAGESAPVTTVTLHDFLKQSRPDDYIAIHAYVHPNAATDAALSDLRAQLRDCYRLATTIGYGPRFLHSTGQLHKGDGGHGLFIQVTANANGDAPIPDAAGRPESSITFGVVKQAQALGDAKTLLDAGRRMIRFDLGRDVNGQLQKLLV